jgi:phage baseplate assembly protein W
MNGTNAQTGKALAGIAHLRQSITDILTTRLGTRVMRPRYGSRLPDLVDAPMNSATIADIRAATAEALRDQEPRIKVTRVTVTSAAPGAVELDLDGIYLPDGQTVNISGIVVR